MYEQLIPIRIFYFVSFKYIYGVIEVRKTYEGILHIRSLIEVITSINLLFYKREITKFVLNRTPVFKLSSYF